MVKAGVFGVRFENFISEPSRRTGGLEGFGVNLLAAE